MQYFIGVQLDGSQHVEPLQNCIAEDTAKEGEQMVGPYSNSLYEFIHYPKSSSMQKVRL